MSAISRRAVLWSGLAAGGGLYVAMGARPSQAGVPSDLNAYVRIGPGREIGLSLARAEMGQGVSTSLAMILAEELDVPLSRVVVTPAPCDIGRYGSQVTGGSLSVRSSFEALRKVGAAARWLLVSEAAARWGVAPESCRTQDAKVVHGASGRAADYADLAAGAAARPTPRDVRPKDRADFRLLGRPTSRLDGRARIDGSVRYGIDAKPPGCRIAVAAYPPWLGGALESVDESAARAIPGVVDIVRSGESVVVIARNTHVACQGRDALKLTWKRPDGPPLSTESMLAALEDALATPGVSAVKTAGLEARLAAPGEMHQATYHQPYLAHAPMEPMSCTAKVSADSCEIWTGTQVMGPAQQAVAKLLALPVDKVVIHNHPLGGAFGRRLEPDAILACVSVARQVSYPVKLVWMRPDDLQQDRFRPAYSDRIEAKLDATGRPVAWRHRIVGSSIMARLYPDLFKGVDSDAVECAHAPLYRLSELQVEFQRVETPHVITSWWRGVGALRSTFVLESFIDELALRAKADPAAFRRGLLDDPRALNVLDRVLAASGWSGPTAPGKGRGLAIQKAFGSYGAMVIDVTVDKEALRVDRITCAADIGLTINPRGAEAQIQGGAIFGLSAALSGEVTFADGAVQQTNFDTYPVLRMSEAPSVEVAIIDSPAAPGGLGELPTILVAPALTNAIASATGFRVRRLPIGDQLSPPAGKA